MFDEGLYKRHLASAKWKRIREEKLKQSQYRCAKCGISKWSTSLEVHHETYDRLGGERLSDLIVLCHKCHQALHAPVIPVETDDIWERYESFDGMMIGRYGQNWQIKLSNQKIEYLFRKYTAAKVTP